MVQPAEADLLLSAKSYTQTGRLGTDADWQSLRCKYVAPYNLAPPRAGLNFVRVNADVAAWLPRSLAAAGSGIYAQWYRRKIPGAAPFSMKPPLVTVTQGLFDIEAWAELLLRTEVDTFSAEVLGVEYKRVQGILYPHPPYKTYLMAKRRGGHRVIREPRRRLKLLQERVLAYLYERAGTPKPCAHAFTKNRSIVTNARKHLERKPHFVLNLDLEAFFPSINFYRVRGVFQKAPFHFSHQVASMLAHMCVVGNELPQGAPTSPLLSNLVCRSMDRDLMALAKRHQATYTRYADDITFSFSTPNPAALPANICTFDGGIASLGNELVSIIEQHNFQINPAETRMSTRRRRMEVTGIVVNAFPNVKRVFIDRIRGGLHAWQKHGYDKAQAEWEKRVINGATLAHEKRPWKRQTRTRMPPELKNILRGKLLFLRMVRGKDDAIYTRLAEKYNQLVRAEKSRNTKFGGPLLPVEPIVRSAEDVNHAVFVIEWSGDHRPAGSNEATMVGCQGTAFAYRRHDRLITCDHVLVATDQLNDTPFTADIEAVPDASLTAINPTTGQSWPVRVVHRDAARDLAILEFVGEPPGRRFFSGTDAPITLHAPGRLIGFPNWNPGRHANQDPAIVTNRLPRTGLQRVEVNELIRAGNSGGPFVDELYRVAGVAQQGAQQDRGNNECLCVMELDRWIAECEASETPPLAAPK